MPYFFIAKARSIVFSFLALACFVNSACVIANPVRIATGEYPPWTSEHLPDGGYINNVVKQAFALSDIDVEFHYMPWKRALEATRLGKYHASSFWGEDESRKQDFLHSQTIENIYFVFFYAKKNVSTDFGWNTLKELKDYRIGATRGYTYNKEFWHLYDQKKLRVSLLNDDLSNLRKLVSGRIDLFPISEFTGQYLLHRNFSSSEINSVGINKKPLSKGMNYILFSKLIEENRRYHKLLNQGLKKLEENGKLLELRRAMFQ